MRITVRGAVAAGVSGCRRGQACEFRAVSIQPFHSDQGSGLFPSLRSRDMRITVSIHNRARGRRVRHLAWIRSSVPSGGQASVPSLRSRDMRITVSIHNRARGRKAGDLPWIRSSGSFWRSGLWPYALRPGGLADRPLERIVVSPHVLAGGCRRRGVRGSLSRLQCGDRLSRQILQQLVAGQLAITLANQGGNVAGAPKAERGGNLSQA
jgi:hypothetical protein